MPSIFPKAEEYLLNFYQSRVESYQQSRIDLNPFHRNGYIDIVLTEDERDKIYMIISDLATGLGMNKSVHHLKVPEDHLTPQKAIDSIIDYKNSIQGDKDKLDKILSNHKHRDVIPYAIDKVLAYINEILEALTHVLTFDEFKPHMQQPPEFYNLYIKTDIKVQIKHALDKKEIEEVLQAIKHADDEIFVAGSTLRLENIETIQIYNTAKLLNTNSKGSLKNEMKQRESVFNTTGLKLLIYSGIEVTDQFTIPTPAKKATKTPINLEMIDVKPLLQNSKNGKIFISHSTQDQQIVNKFIEQILILGLNVKREAIFCSSDYVAGIKSGDDFKKAIKDNLIDAIVVIQMITINYKKSEVCLNEMGAAWVSSSTVIPLIASPFNYDLGFIHAGTQQLMLNSKEDLTKLYDDHKDLVFTEKINVNNLQAKVTEFVKFIEDYTIKQNIKTDGTIFYNELVNIKGILREGVFSHPPADEDTPTEALSFHRFYIVELSKSINVFTNEIMIEEGDSNLSRINIDKIQIVPNEKTENVDLKDYRDKEVFVTGKCWGGFNAWHRSDVLMTFNDIKVIEN